jgi:hypothetical protein
LHLEESIDDLESVDDQRVVRFAQPQPHQLHEVRADLLVRSQARVDEAILDRQHVSEALGAGGDHRRHTTNVVRGHAVVPGERCVARRGPHLDAAVPEVRYCQSEAPRGLGQMARTADQRSDANGKREGIEAGILFPAVLFGRGAVACDPGQRPLHHVANVDAVERV